MIEGLLHVDSSSTASASVLLAELHAYARYAFLHNFLGLLLTFTFTFEFTFKGS